MLRDWCQDPLTPCVAVFSNFQEITKSDFGHDRSGTKSHCGFEKKDKKYNHPASTRNTIVSIWVGGSHIKTKNRGKYFICAVSAGVSRYDAWQIIEK